MLLILLALAFACGCERAPAAAGSAPSASPAPPREPYAGSPLVGRWSRAGRTLEFLADGTLVDLVESEAQRSTRLADGTRKEETVARFQCSMGAYRVDRDRVEYELAVVLSDRHVAGAWAFRVEGTALALEANGEREEFERDDVPVPEGARPLIGLWRRVNGKDFRDMGVRFPPGGLSIAVGMGSKWGNGVGATIGWLCLFATYEVDGETRRSARTTPIAPAPARSRSRTIGSRSTRSTSTSAYGVSSRSRAASSTTTRGGR